MTSFYFLLVETQPCIYGYPSSALHLCVLCAYSYIRTSGGYRATQSMDLHLALYNDIRSTSVKATTFQLHSLITIDM